MDYVRSKMKPVVKLTQYRCRNNNRHDVYQDNHGLNFTIHPRRPESYCSWPLCQCNTGTFIFERSVDDWGNQNDESRTVVRNGKSGSKRLSPFWSMRPKNLHYSQNLVVFYRANHISTTRKPSCYSTVTDFARLRGWSTLQPRRTAIWYERSCKGMVATRGTNISLVSGISIT